MQEKFSQFLISLGEALADGDSSEPEESVFSAIASGGGLTGVLPAHKLKALVAERLADRLGGRGARVDQIADAVSLAAGALERLADLIRPVSAAESSESSPKPKADFVEPVATGAADREADVKIEKPKSQETPPSC